MSGGVRDTNAMIAGMTPVLLPGTFAFATWPKGRDWPEGTRASCVEDEGLSLVVPVDAAPQGAVAMRCITLSVHSSLEGVGLTAAVSAALAERNIPANMIAGAHHDHVYIPNGLAEKALAILLELQGNARA